MPSALSLGDQCGDIFLERRTYLLFEYTKRFHNPLFTTGFAQNLLREHKGDQRAAFDAFFGDWDAFMDERKAPYLKALSDIRIRDPFILPVANEGRYYLFGTTDVTAWAGVGEGFDCYYSTNLHDWKGPIAAFRPPQAFWATCNFWAPEVHRYAIPGYPSLYFMLATFKAEDRFRGTQILAAQRPEGPYLPWSEGPVTPPDHECLDGTLHMDADGRPWMVYCHEWLQIHDGTFEAIPLTPDLRCADGPPVTLWRASDAAWTRPLPAADARSSAPLADAASSDMTSDGPLAGKSTEPLPHEVLRCYVSDGPWLHRTAAGALLCLWSSLGETGYAMGVSRSESGTIAGPWTHLPEPLWPNNGGHGMLFRDFTGHRYPAPAQHHAGARRHPPRGGDGGRLAATGGQDIAGE